MPLVGALGDRWGDDEDGDRHRRGLREGATKLPVSIPRMTVGTVGALLVGEGAVLLLIGPPVGLTGISWRGTIITPGRRLASGFSVVGSVFVAVGSALLLLGSRNLDVLVVVATLVVATALVYAGHGCSAPRPPSGPCAGNGQSATFIAVVRRTSPLAATRRLIPNTARPSPGAPTRSVNTTGAGLADAYDRAFKRRRDVESGSACPARRRSRPSGSALRYA